MLRKPDGTPYDGTNSDNEGLAVLPDGDYLLSSETEPSIRTYDRAGVQTAALPIPARFAVTGTTPDGQATSNATLEGLTSSRSGREIIAAMEGALSGDVSASGDATLHRFLVYDAGRHGTWQLTKQIAYRTEAGNRVPEVAAEGMAITFGGPGVAGVSMISDDNFSATQFSRVLNLLVRLP